MKHNTSTVIAENDDDDGEGNNARNTPNNIKISEEIMLLNTYTIDDFGRFNNSYDIVNISIIYGQTNKLII